MPYEECLKPKKIVILKTYIKSCLKGSKKVQKISNGGDNSSSTSNLHNKSNQNIQ